MVKILEMCLDHTMPIKIVKAISVLKPILTVKNMYLNIVFVV